MAQEVGERQSQAEKLVVLGSGLELWRVPVAELREQDVNARTMPAGMFDRLAATIARDQRLESLPLCASTAKGIEVISGHHRTRGAIAAGLKDVFCIVDVTGLTPSQIKAKQLAHNAIQGEDNAQLVAKIFQAIEDAESRLEAFIDGSVQPEIEKVKVEDVGVQMAFKSVGIVFIPIEKEAFESAAKVLADQYESLYLAERKGFDPFAAIVHRVNSEYEILSMGTVLSKMAEIVAEHLGAPPDPNVERVSLRDLLGTLYVPKEDADKLKLKIKAAVESGRVLDRERWKILQELT